jgi:hypothetical protein
MTQAITRRPMMNSVAETAISGIAAKRAKLGAML